MITKTDYLALLATHINSKTVNDRISPAGLSEIFAETGPVIDKINDLDTDISNQLNYLDAQDAAIIALITGIRAGSTETLASLNAKYVTLSGMVGDGSIDVDTVINQLTEVYALLQSFSEGSNLIAILANKVDSNGTKVLSDNNFTTTLLTKLNAIQALATANATDASLRDRSTHTGSQSADTVTDGTTNKAYTAAEKTKLTGIAPSATANDTDANLKARANHSGTQTSVTISDFTEAVQDAVAALLAPGTNLTITYNDAGNTLTLNAAAGVTDPEAVRDAIGAAMVGVGVISVVINDAGDTITISSTATANSTDAALRDRTTHTGSQSADTVSDTSSTNKFWTNTRTLTSVLTGWVVAVTTAAISASDSVSVAFGKVQKYINDILTALNGYTHAEFLTLSAAQKQGIKSVRDTTANLTTANYIYPASWKIEEVGVGIKIADSVTAYNSLTFGVATDLLTLVDPLHFIEDSNNKLSIIDSYLSSMFLDRRYGSWTTSHGFAGINATNTPVPTLTGTYVGKVLVPNATTYYEQRSKVNLLSTTATAQSVVVLRNSRLEYNLLRGFNVAFMFCPADGLLTTKNQYGITSDLNPLSVITEPSATTTIHKITVGNDTGDTNFQIISGPGTALLKLDLGASFPKTLTDMLHIRIKAPKNATTVQVIVTKISKTDGSVLAQETRTLTGTSLPTSGSGLCRQLWRCSGVDAVAPSFDYFDLELQIPPIL